LARSTKPPSLSSKDRLHCDHNDEACERLVADPVMAAGPASGAPGLSRP